MEIDKCVAKLVNEEGIALEKFMEKTLSVLHPKDWKRVQLVRQQTIKDSIVETVWSIRLEQEEVI